MAAQDDTSIALCQVYMLTEFHLLLLYQVAIQYVLMRQDGSCSRSNPLRKISKLEGLEMEPAISWVAVRPPDHTVNEMFQSNL